MIHPLQEMIKAGNKTKVVRQPGRKPIQTIVWTSEADDSFEAIKAMINNCPKLFYIDDKLPIYLNTDASNYAIGAYLYQIKNNKEVPIRFMSKTLTGAQLNWSTIEKECFAMFFSLTKFASLLLGVPFILRTDHKNLLYLNNAGSPKVTRWKIELQNYDFRIEHVAGVDNIPADVFSRLVIPWSAKPQIISVLSDTSEMNQIEGSVQVDVALCHDPNSCFHFEDQQDIFVLQHPSYSEERSKDIALHHGPLGHFGVEKTYQSALEGGLEQINLREDITEFIKLCPICQKMSYVRPVIRSLSFVLGGSKPMYKLSLDTVGPIDPDEEGYKYVIAFIDNFTRYTTLHRVKDTSAKAAAEALFEHCCTYGVPKEIQTDNGTQFKNSLVSNLTSLYNNKNNLSIAYSSEENGIVERVIREVNRHLRILTTGQDRSKQWSRFVPFVQRLINGSEHSSVKYSPS